MKWLRWLWHMRLAWWHRAIGDRHALKATIRFGRAKAHEAAADRITKQNERGETFRCR